MSKIIEPVACGPDGKCLTLWQLLFSFKTQFFPSMISSFSILTEAFLKTPKHPESVNYDSLEAGALMRTFTPPLIFVTARGMKKVDTFNHDTYTIHTNV